MTVVPVKTALACKAEVEDVIAHLAAVEDRLVDRSIAFAKTNGYAPYTTTIRAAWSEAIRSLTDCLCQYLRAPAEVTRGPRAAVTYRGDHRFTRMRQIARRHRSMGITLELYIGLFKHFRRVYIDDLSQRHGPALLDRVQDFFDESELSVTADWTAPGDDRRLSELQERTRDLTLQKDRYVAVFESLRNPAFLLDHAQGLVHANHAAIELFIGEGEVGDSLYLADRQAMKRVLAARISDLLTQDEDQAIWLETTTGRACFDVRLRPLQDAVDNTSLGYLLQLYDVTAHRLATEQAQRAERQMSRFLATMSHEIRTPLHGVLGAADLLRDADPADRHMYLDVIQSAGQSLLQTLNNVLDYSKLETGPPVPHPVATEIRSTLETFRNTIVLGRGPAAPNLAIEIAKDVPDRLMIDWSMARQVLSNLVANALRHDDGGGVQLSVTQHPAGPSSSLIRFHVRDHGPGFRDEDARRFRRPYEDTKPRYTAQGGAGLGLAISRYLVAAIGGEIGLENTLTGAHVWFTVPCDSGGPETTTAGVTDARAAHSLTRCLLVDDDAIGAVITRQQLRSLGLRVDHAASVAEARQALDRDCYDVVVADYLLPDGTGPELVLSALRRDRPMRWIALTANAEALRAAQDAHRVFDAVLEKPADVASLAQVLPGHRAVPDHTPLTPAKDDPPNPAVLAGLSPQTIAAMAVAFSGQWSGFRRDLADLHRSGRIADLAETAHRLAGSTAQLGLVELLPHLRALERQGELADNEITELIAQLDLDLGDLATWRALQCRVGVT